METKVMWMQTDIALPLSGKNVLVCYNEYDHSDSKGIIIANHSDELFYSSDGKPMEKQPTHWAYYVETP